MEKIKLLFIVTQGEMGGAQRYVFDLATNLNSNPPQSPLTRGEDRRGYEILVAMGGEKLDLKMKLEQAGIKTVVLKHLVRNIHPIHDILAVFEIKRLIVNYQPGIVHLNSGKAGGIGSVAAALAGKKNVVFTAHGFSFLEPHAFSGLYFWAEKIASYFRKIIITVSEHDRRAAIHSQLCDPKKMATIHNGIELTPHLASPTRGKEKNGDFPPPCLPVRQAGGEGLREGDGITIGTIAQDYPTKDLKTLRQAFDLVKTDYADAQLKILSNVPDAAEQLPTFDIYACSSIKEGFPYSILEAMSAGLPIVSTSVGGIPEMITDGESGLLVPPRSPAALAAAIKKLILDKPLAKKIGENAKLKVQQFSLEKMVKATEAIYQSIIDY